MTTEQVEEWLGRVMQCDVALYEQVTDGVTHYSLWIDGWGSGPERGLHLACVSPSLGELLDCVVRPFLRAKGVIRDRDRDRDTAKAGQLFG